MSDAAINPEGANGSAVGRLLILVYGATSYLVGVAGLVCLILAYAHLLPFGFLSNQSLAYPLLLNLALVAGWGVIHTAMARDGFKQALTRVIPEPAERPTYVLVAGITSIILVGYWQILPGTLWSTTHLVLVPLLWALCAFGWVYLLAATFAINHFDLFGLRQVYLNFRNQPRPPLQFVKRAMYRFSRHPIQTGVLIGIWATPVMSMTKLVLSVGFTVYIFIGLWFEEKDLVKDIGEPYEAYRREAGMFLPRIFNRG